jgi:hypothetical protein
MMNRPIYGYNIKPKSFFELFPEENQPDRNEEEPNIDIKAEFAARGFKVL